MSFLLLGCVEPPPEHASWRGGPIFLESEQGLAQADIEVEGGQFLQGSNELHVDFASNDGASEIALVSAGAFMPAHSHGTDPVTLVQERRDHYRIEDILLFMPGSWEISMQVEVGGATDEFVFVADVQ